MLGDEDDADGDDPSKSLVQEAEAGRLDRVEALLRAKANVNVTDADGQTALHCAVEHGHEAVVTKLLAARAGLEHRDGLRETTPLHRATENGHEAVVAKLLIARADMEQLDGVRQWTPLMCAQLGGSSGGVIQLLEAAEAGRNLQHVLVQIKDEVEIRKASFDGMPAAVGRLLASRTSVNAADAATGRTPLHEAAREGHDAVVIKLLDARANFEHCTEYPGETALHNAAEQGHSVVVAKLLEARAATEQREQELGQTPLHFAAANGHCQSLQLLLAAKASVEAQNTDGKTPLNLANSIDVAELLEDAASPDAVPLEAAAQVVNGKLPKTTQANANAGGRILSPQAEHAHINNAAVETRQEPAALAPQYGAGQPHEKKCCEVQ